MGKLDGNKTYFVAGAMVALSIFRHVFPDIIPADIYQTAQEALNYLLYGTVGHKLLKTVKQPKGAK